MPSVRFATVRLLTVVCAACGEPGTSAFDASVRDSAASSRDAQDADSDASPADDASPPDDAEVGQDLDPKSLEPHWQPTVGVPPSSRRGRWGAVLVHDPEARRLILHGGSHYPNGPAGDTWAFDIDTELWLELETTNPPAPRFCHCATYLPDTRELLIINGRDEEDAVPRGAFTLSLETGVWSPVESEAPDGLVGCNSVYDPLQERVFVFGGASTRGFLSSTWSYDPRARVFTELSLGVSPSPRRDAMMVYDATRGRTLLFGGQTGRNSHANDVWGFDGESWQPITVDLAPPARRWGSSGIDALGQWLIFGGTDERESMKDLWRFDPSTEQFEELSLRDGPMARAGAAHSFLEDRQALFVFGGFESATFAAHEDGWVLGFR